MACAACEANKNRKTAGFVSSLANQYPPYNSTDIAVYDGTETRALTQEDWPKDRHKLLLFYPETFTPVCTSEMGAVSEWIEPFNQLSCDVYSVTADDIDRVEQWYKEDEALSVLNYKALSSFLLPQRLGIMNGNTCKRASVFITTEGDVIIHEHFMKVGRSLKELHRTMYAYTTGSYCGEGWTDPSDGFLTKELKHENH